MRTSSAAADFVPAAMITHNVASIRGAQHTDVTVHHARTTDARISMSFSGIHMTVYSCDAAQGLLEAFDAARGHMARLPRHIPAVDAGPIVETTGAGDAFTGGFATALAEGMNLIEATQFACAVAGISVTRPGTAPSMPCRQEIDASLPKNKVQK